MNAPDESGVTRGGLLKWGAFAAVSARAGSGSAVAAGAFGSGLGRPSGGARHLRRSSFVPLLGTSFLIRRAGERRRVRLVEVKGLRGPGESFSLLFQARKPARVEQDTYRIEHPMLGSFELFLVPVGRGAKGQDLEAVVNRVTT